MVHTRVLQVPLQILSFDEALHSSLDKLFRDTKDDVNFNIETGNLDIRKDNFNQKIQTDRKEQKPHLRVGGEAHRQLSGGLHHQLIVRQGLSGLHNTHNRRFYMVTSLLFHSGGDRLAQAALSASTGAVPVTASSAVGSTDFLGANEGHFNALKLGGELFVEAELVVCFDALKIENIVW